MKEKVEFCDISRVANFCDLNSVKDDVKKAFETLVRGDGAGNENLGWLQLPENYNNTEEFNQIKEVAKEISVNADVLLVIGIGGSYLGARAGIETQKGVFHNNIAQKKKGELEIYFVGTNLNGEYFKSILQLIENKSVYVNVISKSGTTLEPAIAFRTIVKHLSNRYSASELQKRIFATTDQKQGALKKLADKRGYKTFVVPDDIGGRYSVLTAVGLLPLAVAGIDIDEIIRGAQTTMDEFSELSENNDCYRYAMARNALYRAGYKIEIFSSYNPAWIYFSEWLKQLFGESEGKDGKGIYPSAMNFTTDLHSLGQFVQDGERDIFKTEFKIQQTDQTIVVSEDEDNYDELNYLSGKSFNDLNKAAQNGTIEAHNKGGVPQILFSIPKNDAFNLGRLFYFFEKACAISAYTLGVNPFNQPGVELYKQEMFKLLRKK